MSNPRNDDLVERLRQIASMDRATCAAALSALPGVTVPPRLRAETLRRRVLRLIAAGKSSSDAAAASATPGTHLVRDWNGRTYRVQVTEAGYVLDGTTYRSLSAVAKRITGTAWSGPRFFGLTGKRAS